MRAVGAAWSRLVGALGAADPLTVSEGHGTYSSPSFDVTASPAIDGATRRGQDPVA